MTCDEAGEALANAEVSTTATADKPLKNLIYFPRIIA